MRSKLLLKIILLLMLLYFNKAYSQPSQSGSLHAELNHAANDTIKMLALDNLASYYAESNRDSAKPTGQGTGLGLLLSYDIVKAHGGELRVESKEGEGSAFTVILP